MNSSNNPAQLAIIDQSIEQYDVLARSAKDMGMHVLTLSDTENKWLELLTLLKAQKQIESLHILVHGQPGQLILDAQTIDTTSLIAHSQDLEQIRTSLADHAECLIYACELGRGAEGMVFLNTLQDYLGCTVAAASHKVGHAELGGTWALDIALGELHTPMLNSADWRGVLGEDPPSSNITLVKDINPGSSGSMGEQKLIVFNGELVFIADDGINGRELWKSDGTAAGTVMIKDINITGDTDSANHSSYNDIQALTELNGVLYFQATDGTNGRELWRTDGTEDGTFMVKNINTDGESTPQFFVTFNDKLYFSARGDSGDLELWVSDGTEAGTELLKDVWPGENSSNPFRGPLGGAEVVGNTLYFIADSDGVRGAELWKTDGTVDGTVLVKDINPSGISNPFSLFAFKDKLYFTANDGTNGIEIWTSDGTAEGTTLFKNINESGDGIRMGSAVFYEFDGYLYFQAQSSGGINPNNVELWRTDGTADGTTLVKEINSTTGSFPSEFQAFNGELYFRADDGTTGNELWKTDGTDEGTVLVKDINESGHSYPSGLTEYNGALYFTANDGDNGFELWKTDGTEASTVLVEDIHPGPGASYPSSLTLLNGKLYFLADNGEFGYQELWSYSDGPINTPAGFNDLGGTPAEYTEGGSAVVLDNDVTISDTELDALNDGAGNYDGASITISRNGGSNAEDLFSHSAPLGSFTEGQAFSYDGTEVGSVTTNSGGTLTLTFNSNATTEIVNAVLQSISYSNSSETPPASVTLDWVFNDGTSDSTGTNQTTINITAVNQAPTDIALSAETISLFADDNTTIANLSVTDPDGSEETYSIISVTAPDSSDVTASNLFSIDGTTLMATSPSTLMMGDYTLLVEVNDGGTENNTYQRTLTVKADGTMIVTTTDDEAATTTDYATESADGNGLSLREAVTIANENDGGTISFATGNGTLATGFSFPFSAVTLDGDSIGSLNLSGGAFVLTDQLTIHNSIEDTVTIANLLNQQDSGSGSMTKTGSGELILTGNNTYTGSTTVSGGRLTLGESGKGGSTLADTTAVTVESGATLKIYGNEVIGSLAGAGTVMMNDDILTVGGDNTDTTFSGTISFHSEEAQLVKTGTGTFIISGSNINLATVNVNEGSLGGSATLGVVNVTEGATLTPGSAANIADQLNTADLTFASGAIFKVELGGNDVGTGVADGYDQVNVTGTVNIDGATLDLSLINELVPTTGDEYIILSNDDADAITGTFAGLEEGATVTTSGGQFKISYVGGDGNDVVLTALDNTPPSTPVTPPAPEPVQQPEPEPEQQPEPEPEPEPEVVIPPTSDWEVLPDEDGDGVPEDIEDFVPSLDGTTQGDGNGDGIDDRDQSEVSSVPFRNTDQVSVEQDAPVVFVTLAATGTASPNDSADSNDNPTQPAAKLRDVTQLDAPEDKPDEMDMPLGLISFYADLEQPGLVQNFSLLVEADENLQVNGYWKQTSSGNWVNLASEAYGGSIKKVGNKWQLDFVIEDGGMFDDDGEVNGVIFDPGAIGFRQAQDEPLSPFEQTQAYSYFDWMTLG